MATQPPEGHPEVDWTKWEPAGQNDVRSPCPMINALANHKILPHNGRGITKEMAVNALATSINLHPNIANVFASVALTANPDHSAHQFDLDHLKKHGIIEHDVSLSRQDAALGDNHSFDEWVWGKYLESYGDAKMTSFESASKARMERMLACKKAHEAAKMPFDYGIKEFIMSYGETALIMAMLGDPKEGKIPIEFLKVLFEQERLPFKEGWRPPEQTVTQSDMNHLIFSLIKANERKSEEASSVGLGTVHAVSNAVTSLLPTYCTIM